MAAHAILMPRLGMTMEEGTVVAWPVALGGRVEKGATVVVIENEKSETEIEATASGYLRHVYVEAGAGVACGTLLAATTDTADEPFDADAFAARHAPRVPRPAPSPPPRAPHPAAATPPAPRRPVTPAARALARTLGVDPADVPGTGPGGRVTKQDVEAWAVAREGRVEVAPGVRLDVRREGAGVPVVLLPGFGTDVSSFAPQTRILAERFEVVAVNPRGVGHSDAPDEPAYSVECAAADAAAVIRSGAPTHVVGASLGAAVALELALVHPERVRSLTLVTPFVDATPRLRAVTDAWCRVAEEASSETLARFLLPWLFGDAWLADASARERTVRGLLPTLRRVPAATLRRAAAGLDAWSGRRGEDVARLGVPTLVLAAGADLLTPDGEALAARSPKARCIVVPGAGHALALEAPTRVSDALLGHLAAS